MRILTKDELKSVPQLPQTQAVLNDQLHDLAFIAQRMGFYDAADYLKDKLGLR